MKIYLSFMWAILLCLSLNASFAQQQKQDTLEIQYSKDKIITFLRLKASENQLIKNSTTFLKKILPIGINDEMRKIKDVIDSKGFSHETFQQYYKGIPVADARYQLHGKNGMLSVIDGKFKKIIDLNPNPTLDEKSSLEKALTAIPANIYKWQDSSYEKLIKHIRKDSKASFRPKGELLIFEDNRMGRNGALKLAWKFIISTLQPIADDFMVMIDAQNGEILQSVSINFHSNTPLTAQTLYSGSQTITGDSYTGGYRLLESRNGITIHTLNLNSSQNFTSATEFSNSTSTFDGSNWSTYYADKQALDVHWAMEKVLDYWLNVHGRNGIDNIGTDVSGYVHYLPSLSGSYYNNANWIHSLNGIALGDGDGSTFNPITSLVLCKV